MLWLPVFLVFVAVYSAAADDLIQANVLWRHGSRAPLFSYKNDFIEPDYWGVSYGELLPLGLQQAYTKGLILRQRYVKDLKLISSDYKSAEIHVRSTDSDRTLMSASGVMAGLYSREHLHGQVSSIHELPSRWTTVPVHTVERDIDYLLNVERNCSKFGELNQEREENEVFLDYLKTKQEIFDHVVNMTGAPISNVLQFRLMLDTFRIEKSTGIELPDWLTPELLLAMETVQNETDDYKTGYPGFGLGMDFDMIRLRAGPLLKQMVSDMMAAVTGSQRGERDELKKIKFYSGHDITVSSLLRNFGAKLQVIGGGMPDFLATIAVELWRRSSADHEHPSSRVNRVKFSREMDSEERSEKERTSYYVKVLYSANTLEELTPITRFVNGCPKDTDDCPLQDFVESAEKVVPRHIERECKE